MHYTPEASSPTRDKSVKVYDATIHSASNSYRDASVSRARHVELPDTVAENVRAPHGKLCTERENVYDLYGLLQETR